MSELEREKQRKTEFVKLILKKFKKVLDKTFNLSYNIIRTILKE